MKRPSPKLTKTSVGALTSLFCFFVVVVVFNFQLATFKNESVNPEEKYITSNNYKLVIRKNKNQITL